MNIKRIITVIIIFLIIFTGLIFYTFQYKSPANIGVTAVNDISQSLAEGWGNLESSGLPGLNYKMDYVVLDSQNKFIKATKNGLNTKLNSAIANRDTIVEIKKDNTVLGKLIIYNNTNIIWRQYRNYLIVFSVILMILAASLCIIYLFYIDNTIFKPFRKLQSFARHVAAGDLDMPLEMDKSNLFGAFTESFDLMREELSNARENERLANQSKKELVASLSHDIKTPVASIKAVTELLQEKSDDDNETKQLDIINSKADQINTLITNMFSATMEELQELKVEATEQSGKIVSELIKKADYNNRVSFSGNAECIILADEHRLAQVIDNIISNSYKYASTSINVSMRIEGDFLVASFRDYGPGVPEDELPLIFNKFYRAKNSAGKSGSGLGLFISKYLMNKMRGDIECQNTEDGFLIILKIFLP